MKRIFAFVMMIFGVAALVGCGTPSAAEPQTEKLAQDLTDAGWIMYGKSACGWCVRQKDLFGGAFAKINYVECSADGMKEVCAVAGVTGTPTRINKKTGQKIEGFRSLDYLKGLLSGSVVK